MKNKIIIILTILVVIMSLIIGIGIGLNLSNKKTEINDSNNINQEINEGQNKEENNDNVQVGIDEEIKKEKPTQTDVEKVVEKELKILLTKKSLSDFTNQDKLQVVFDLYREKNGYKETISKKELENLYKNSSLRNMDIKYENIYFYYMLKPSDELLYEIKGDNYVKVEGGHGVPTLDTIYKKITNYNQDADKITISCKYAFYRVDGDGPNPIDLYYTYDDAINGKNNITTYNPNDYMTDDDPLGYQGAKSAAEKYNFSNVLDKLDTYTYTFKIIDNELVLVDFNRR